MADGALQLTLREWRRFVTAPRTVAAVAGAGFVLGLSGPFDTFSLMRPGARILYWLVIAFSTFAVGLLTARALAEATPVRRLGWLPAYIVSAIIGGVPVTGTVLLVNWLGGVPANDGWRDIAILYLYCSAICICVTMLVAVQMRKQDESAPAAASPPALLKRLPVELRGSLSHLSMQDHYVHVFTDRGDTLVLMRFADAIAETRPVPGLRIHRSHWVALGAVARTRREGDRHLVELKDGTVLPISRSSLPAAREAGLLPQ